MKKQYERVSYEDINLYDHSLSDSFVDVSLRGKSLTAQNAELDPLMDFNKAFTSYDTLEGAICQTSNARLSQKDAAIEAVQQIGLNQITDVRREWFSSEEQWEMFNRRLEILRKAE